MSNLRKMKNDDAAFDNRTRDVRHARERVGNGHYFYSDCDDDDDNNIPYEPNWSHSVREKGDLFFVEANLPNGDSSSNTFHDSSAFSVENDQSSEQSSTPRSNRNKRGHKKKKKGFLSNRNGLLHSNDMTEKNQESNGQISNGFEEIVGPARDIYLFVDPFKNNYGRRATLCESLFGIVPGRFNEKNTERNGTTTDKRIMVQAMTPGGVAIKSGAVKIGDWLVSINDLEMTSANMDSLLGAITSPKEVKLTLQKISLQVAPRPSIVKKNSGLNEHLVRLVSGERLSEIPPSLDRINHCVLYLTLDHNSETMNSKDDILYQFPRKENKLIDVRGLFITLSHMMIDITNNTAKNSTLMVGDELVHVGYSVENKEVLVLAVPAERISLLELNHVMTDFTRMIKVLYGTLHNGFSQKDNHDRLDHFFSLALQRVLLTEDFLKRGAKFTDFVEPLFDILPAVRSLTLPEESKIMINNCLGELEAAEFADMSDDFYDLRRTYTVIGSCLFYKGYLIGNHLHNEDLMDVTLYLRHYCLLTLSNEEQMGQMVVWKEMYPWRRCHFTTDPVLPGYTEPEARWFLLVVGMKNCMLGVILEAGGCAEWAEGHPTPDPFYVDQVKATILQLETHDVPSQCEMRLQAPPMPSLASVDWFLPQVKGKDSQQESKIIQVMSPRAGSKKSQDAFVKKKSSPSSSVDSRGNYISKGIVYDMESDDESRSMSDGSTPLVDRRGRKFSAGSEGSEGSGGSSSLFRGGKRRRNMLSAYDVQSLKRSVSDMGPQEEGSFVKLTSGCENTLFHYVQMDSLDGVFICPTQQELGQVISPNHSILLRNFHQSCLAIRKVFEHSTKLKTSAENGKSSKFGVDNSLGNVKEHGILFQCKPEKWTDPKKQSPTMTYWVVGRVFDEPYPRELYVCFHDSAQQNMVELAFKLAFGVIV